jgi:hypothetical protein
MTAASLSEWAQMVSLAVGIYATASTPYFLLVDAERWAWPRPVVAAVERVRPAVWDGVRSEAVYPLLREFDNGRHAVREMAAETRLFARLSLREAALTAAALLALLTITPEHTR